MSITKSLRKIYSNRQNWTNGIADPRTTKGKSRWRFSKDFLEFVSSESEVKTYAEITDAYGCSTRTIERAREGKPRKKAGPKKGTRRKARPANTTAKVVASKRKRVNPVIQSVKVVAADTLPLIKEGSRVETQEPSSPWGSPYPDKEYLDSTKWTQDKDDPRMELPPNTAYRYKKEFLDFVVAQLVDSEDKASDRNKLAKKYGVSRWKLQKHERGEKTSLLSPKRKTTNMKTSKPKTPTAAPSPQTDTQGGHRRDIFSMTEDGKWEERVEFISCEQAEKEEKQMNQRIIKDLIKENKHLKELMKFYMEKSEGIL